METNEDKKGISVEFIYNLIISIIIWLSYIVLLTDGGDIYLSALFYILPCLTESIRSLALEKHLITKRLIWINWISVLASITLGTICIIGAKTNLNVNIVIKFLALTYVAKSTSYTIYYWKKV